MWLDFESVWMAVPQEDSLIDCLILKIIERKFQNISYPAELYIFVLIRKVWFNFRDW